MTTIVTRASKGSPLSNDELDTNFTNLSNDVITLFSNAQSQQDTLNFLSPNVSTMDANLGTATTNITTLFANAATQSTAITTLTSNAATQSTAIAAAQADVTTLYANAATQSTSITTLTANAATQAVAIQSINANLGAFETYANSTFSTSTYSNATAASYLPVYGGSVNALNITGVAGQDITLEPDGTGDVSLNADTIKIGDNNTDVTLTTRGTGNLLIRTHNGDATQGNITLVNGANGNIKLWPHGTGVVDIARSAVVQGNVSANYFLGDGSKLTGIVGQASYTDSNVAAYLPGYTGTIAASSTIIDLYSNAATQSTAISGIASDVTTLYSNAATQSTAISGIASDVTTLYSNAATQSTAISGIASDVTTLYSNAATQSTAITGITSDVATLYSNAATQSTAISGVAADVTTLYANAATQSTAITGITAGTTTLANVRSTNGYFWSNGTAYSNGDLAGSTLSDSVNLRIFANASGASAPTVADYAWSKNIVAPNYIGGVFNIATPSATQTTNNAVTTALFSANIPFQSTYQTTSLTNAFGALSYVQTWPVTANSMSNNDRVRALGGVIDVFMNGKTWGANLSAASPAVGINGVVNAIGNGTHNGIQGMQGICTVTPTDLVNSANITYITGFQGALTMYPTFSTSAKANVAYFRAVNCTTTGISANLVVRNAIGVFTASGWAGTGVTSATTAQNRYALLNEDQYTSIKTNGNIVFSATATISTVQLASYSATTVNTLAGAAGMIVSITNGTGKNAGQLAYWDTTNTRWSWVDSNLAVT